MNEARAFRKFLDSYQVSGLDIRLDIHIDLANKVKFLIVFQNTSSEEILLPFNSRAINVAAENLHFWDMENQYINWTSKIGSSQSFKYVALHPIPPGGEWRYRLEGLLAKDILGFLGCAYPLKSGLTYYVQYAYPFDRLTQHRSNTIT